MLEDVADELDMVDAVGDSNEEEQFLAWWCCWFRSAGMSSTARYVVNSGEGTEFDERRAASGEFKWSAVDPSN